MIKRCILKGDIIFSKISSKFEEAEEAYLLCEDKFCRGVVKSIPDSWKDVPVKDYSGCLIMPGFIDLHAHAPQYVFAGIGMDLQLLDWLDNYTFPAEAKYADKDYAFEKYSFFTNKLLTSATTRAVLFGTIHADSDLILAKLLEKTGLKILLGKVNMNRNSAPNLTETTQDSIEETERFVKELANFNNVKPIITPRFVPSCTADLMSALGEIAKKYNLPIQSHLDENLGEIDWVAKLHPECSSYTDVYKKYGLLDDKTIMAHCVHVSEVEQKTLKENGTFIAHCPQSNVNLTSGVAPAVHYLQDNQKIGLGTDIAGGTTLSMFRAASDAIRSSKLRFYYTKEDRALSVSEAFFMATKGGGEFFGKVGSFENDFEFDAIVVDDSSLGPTKVFSPAQRLERVLYQADERNIKAKFVEGRCIYEEC